ncbi:hypothetical protein [Lentibacillus juripiscarius]|uniref:PPM-type phosphatase domain-containing protein n=1 Tax=Lentibacillus juripiscarius TaxID=257446 RepID=A0ABW5V6Y9_9BACI
MDRGQHLAGSHLLYDELDLADFHHGKHPCSYREAGMFFVMLFCGDGVGKDTLPETTIDRCLVDIRVERTDISR